MLRLERENSDLKRQLESGGGNGGDVQEKLDLQIRLNAKYTQDIDELRKRLEQGATTVTRYNAHKSESRTKIAEAE